MKLPKDPLSVSLISLVFGSLFTYIVTKIRNKSGVFKYAVQVNHIALSVEDPVFGNVKVSWRDTEVRNLFAAVIDVENTSSRDYESVNFKVYTTDDTQLLNEKAEIVDAPYAVGWSDDYMKKVAVPEGGTPTDAQNKMFYHSREYIVPVLNRGQKLQFTYLCTKFNDQHPEVCLSTLTRGVKLKYQDNLNCTIGVPVKVATMRGLVISVLVVIGLGLIATNVWLTASISMLVGLCAQFLGAVEYRAERFIINLITG